jgi:hypothetical protein
MTPDAAAPTACLIPVIEADPTPGSAANAVHWTPNLLLIKFAEPGRELL